MKTHRIWSNLVDFTKVEFEKQGGEVGGVGDEFATDLEKRIGSPTRSSPGPPPVNATCISLRSESDRSDSRLRSFGWPFITNLAFFEKRIRTQTRSGLRQTGPGHWF